VSSEIEELNLLKETLAQLSDAAPNITSSFKTTNSNKILISPDAEGKTTTIDKRERKFWTDSPIFLRRIYLAGENLQNIEVIALDSNAQNKAFNVTIIASGANCFINQFCNSFYIRAKGKDKRPVLSKIMIFGASSLYLTQNTERIASFFTESNLLANLLTKTEEKINSHIQVIAEQEAIITSNRETLADIKKQSNNFTSSNAAKQQSANNLNKAVAKAEQKLALLNQEETAKTNSIQQLEEETRILNVNIAQTSEKLSALINDKNLISDEFRDYVTEGKNQSRAYLLLMILPCITIAVCAGFLIDGASDIMHGKYETKNDVAAALLLRIPIAAAVGAAIYFSASIAAAFLKRIFSIEEERLTLAKLLVIAKDTVFSTAENLGSSIEQKLYLRTKLKIELLKAHLSRNLSPTFELPPLQQQPEVDPTKNQANDE